MSLSASVWLVIVLALVAANLPFFNDRWLAVWPARGGKGLGARVFELVVLYGVVGGIALSLEHSAGQVYPQGWEFYATTATLFVTLAFPGFVFQYLRRR